MADKRLNYTAEEINEILEKADTMELPTKISQLINDSEYITENELDNKGFLTEHQDISNKADKSELHSHNNKSVLDDITSEKINEWDNKSDFSGDYNDLTNKPTIPTKTSQLTNDSNFLTSVPSEYITESELNSKGYLTQHQDISGKADKTELHNHSNKTVLDSITSAKVVEWDNKSGFSGSYNDLTNKPTIPTKTSQLTNDSNFITSIPSEYVTDSELNAKGYATEEYVNQEIYTKSAYGTCSTPASTAEKVVVVEDENWKLEVGSIVVIKHSATNSASNVTINVNNTGAYPIWANSSEYTSTSSNYTGAANRIITYIFDGTHWVWLSQGVYPSSTSNASLGQGYGVCSTAETTLAKTATISSFSLETGGIVSIKFNNAVPANSTLNIRSKGAKKIFYKGSAITDGIIKAGDTATFIYDGTQFQLISIDVDYATKDYVDNTVSDAVDNCVKTVNGIAPNAEGNVVVTATLEAPEVVDSIKEMTDTNKQYVLSTDGFIYTYKKVYTPSQLIPNFTNRLNTDGTDFTLNTRLSTSSTSALDGVAISNAISSKKGDVIYVKNLDIFDHYTTYMRFGMWLDGTRVNAVDGASSYYLKQKGYITTHDDGVVSFKLISASNGTDFSSDWDTIKFNIPMLDDYSESIITVNEPIEYTIVEETYEYQWTNTGISYMATDYSEVIKEMQNNIGDLEEAISNLGDTGESIPSYWKSELENKVDNIQQVMEGVGRNKSAFYWYTDAHWQTNAKKSPMLFRYLTQNTPINKINFGGDIINDPNPHTHDNIKYVYDWRKSIADLPNHHSVLGNHDLHHWSTDVHKIAYANILAYEETNDMVVSDVDGCYYIDCPSEKTRYLYLCYLINRQTDMTAQGQFIVDSIKSVKEGWHIIAINHRWFQYASSSTPTTGSTPGYESEILDIFDKYNARTTRGSSNYFDAQDFTSSKGKVEFCIGGHIHVDYDFASPGGIPVIITAADTNQERAAEEDEDCGVVGTITEQAVYAIIADYANSKINVVGIGRGGSREVSLN